MSKSNYILLASLFAFSVFAQDPHKKPLTLDEAIGLSMQNGKEIKKANAKTNASKLQINSAKNLRYPNLEVSGQYMHLFEGTDVKLKIPMPGQTGESGTSPVKPEHLLMGQANAIIPVFSGFKIRNLVKQSQQAYEMATIAESATAENTVWQTINLYFALYKTQQSIDLLQENLKRAHQRVVDFQNFLDNGLIARNDFLRAQLQESNVELSLQETLTSFKNLNMRLNTILGLPIGEAFTIQPIKSLDVLPTSESDTESRKDLQGAQKNTELAQSSIRVARSGYYPSIALHGGYAAMQLDKVIDITNANNIGIGLKYDLSSIFKNRTEVKIAKAKKIEADYQLQIVEDNANYEIKEAFNAYELALKKNNVLAQALEQANENYRITKDKYDNGLADTDQLLEADVQQLQAQINEMIGKADETMSLYQYAYKTGKLLDNIELQ